METLEKLYEMAEHVNENWTEQEGIDWSQAEQLVHQCKCAPSSILEHMPNTTAILAYTESHNEWESDLVAGWPAVIMDEIENYDHSYFYRQEGENWTVFSLALTGQKEWKATVETEALAEALVDLLSAPTDVKTVSTERCQTIEIIDFSEQDIDLEHLHLQSREWTVDCEINKRSLIVDFSYEHDLAGRMTLNIAGMKSLYDALQKFFTPTKRGPKFNYNSEAIFVEGLPNIHLSTTNWGEPYDRGIQFTLRKHDEALNTDQLHFQLTDRDLLDLTQSLRKALAL